MPSPAAAAPGPFRADLLTGKTILVTGGATGLGRAMAEGFGRLGARVALAGRREEKLREAEAALAQAGCDVFVHACDVRDPEAVARLADALDARFGGIDVLVNNAAGNFISPTERLSHRAVDAVLNIVLHGTFYATLEFGKRWIAAGRPGTVLNIVTTYAETGSAYVVPSAAAKAGVLAMTRSLAVEWARYGIRHVAIAPGPFPTEGAWSRLLPTPELAQGMIDRIPLKRVGSKEELADLASYLVSDYAGYLNGECVTIDGGEWLQGAGQFNGLLAVTEPQWDQLAELSRKGGK
ncbi:SDR family oxidoreductase [Paenibacillus sp. B01]|uniref:SDR family oxidoreductase n=1 Tax=Paenibacillus sp. B01 TaxID=2660554 RepID=UPI00129BB1FD|nr:SDR family oxidoreductase [Paenibacillus sp. B01]QGG58755.1 SDR family oxidoreductase [Paenibacillus sp. B01]